MTFFELQLVLCVICLVSPVAWNVQLVFASVI